MGASCKILLKKSHSRLPDGTGTTKQVPFMAPHVTLLITIYVSSVCQERPSETSSNVDSSAQPSVAQLAGRFREQAAVAREVSLNAWCILFREGRGLEEGEASRSLRRKRAGGVLAITKLGREAGRGPSECGEFATPGRSLGRVFPSWGEAPTVVRRGDSRTVWIPFRLDLPLTQMGSVPLRPAWIGSQ